MIHRWRQQPHDVNGAQRLACASKLVPKWHAMMECQSVFAFVALARQPKCSERKIAKASEQKLGIVLCCWLASESTSLLFGRGNFVRWMFRFDLI